MLDRLSSREQFGLSGAFAIAIVAAFGLGSFFSGSTPTGAFSGDAPGAQIEERVQSIISQQEAQQQQQLAAVANRSESLSSEDLSISTELEGISRSEFGSLYKVIISTSGEVPNRLGNGTRSLDESQEMYISSDGRYLFSPPTDLEQQASTQRSPQPR